jgi:hypothetical protein
VDTPTIALSMLVSMSAASQQGEDVSCFGYTTLTLAPRNLG